MRPRILRLRLRLETSRDPDALNEALTRADRTVDHVPGTVALGDGTIETFLARVGYRTTYPDILPAANIL